MAADAAGASVPPAGSRAEAVLHAALAGTYDANMLREDAAAAGAASSSSPKAVNPYAPRVSYSPRFATSKRNPAEHTYAQAGRYYNLGGDAEMSKAFPSGLPGQDLAVETSVTGANALLIRPLGVSLVAHMEHWRQTHGRTLAAAGARVLDINPAVAYTPPSLDLPPTREAAVGGAGAAGGAANSAAARALAFPPAALIRPTAESDVPLGEAHPHAAKFRPLRMLVGPRGSGKSALLAYAVHYARSNGWLTLLVPDALAIARKGQVLAPSRLRPGMIDQHDVALALLRDTAVAHGEALGRVAQRGRYAKHRYLPAGLDAHVSVAREELRKREETERARAKAQAEAAGRIWDPASFRSAYEDESDRAIDRSGFTLRDMVEWGLRHPPAATDTLLDFLSELRSVTEFPVLIAVDGLNHFYEQGPYAWEGKDVPLERLSVQAAFAPLGPNGFKESCQLKRGMWLTSVSHKAGSRLEALFDGTKARVGMKYRVSVPPLTRQEVFSQLSHYKASGGFLMLDEIPSIDPFAVEYYRTLSGGNPWEILRSAMFTP